MNDFIYVFCNVIFAKIFIPCVNGWSLVNLSVALMNLDIFRRKCWLKILHLQNFILLYFVQNFAPFFLAKENKLCKIHNQCQKKTCVDEKEPNEVLQAKCSTNEFGDFSATASFLLELFFNFAKINFRNIFPFLLIIESK